jgi:hypothetical protein
MAAPKFASNAVPDFMEGTAVTEEVMDRIKRRTENREKLGPMAGLGIAIRDSGRGYFNHDLMNMLDIPQGKETNLLVGWDMKADELIIRPTDGPGLVLHWQSGGEEAVCMLTQVLKAAGLTKEQWYRRFERLPFRRGEVRLSLRDLRGPEEEKP